MKSYDVVALGELLIDFTMNGQSEQGNPLFEANPGGAPCNVLSMLQNLGRKTAFIGKVGDDFLGKMLIETVKNQGISTENLLMDAHIPTTLAFVHTASDGDRSFSFYRKPGADIMLRKEEIQKELLEQTRVFHFGSLSMTHPEIEDATKAAIQMAKDAGAIISFDPNLRVPLWDSLEVAREKIAYGISQCDILKISDDEIAFFTGEADIDKGVSMIRQMYDIPLICATMGKNGSKAYYQRHKVACKPFIQKNTIETTGAGDTFMACVIHAVLEHGLGNMDGTKLYDMLRFANAAAALITTRKGALKVMPDKNEVNTLLETE